MQNEYFQFYKSLYNFNIIHDNNFRPEFSSSLSTQLFQATHFTNSFPEEKQKLEAKSSKSRSILLLLL